MPRANDLGLPAWAWAMIAFAVGLAITLWFASASQERQVQERQRVFSDAAQNTYTMIERHLKASEFVARSAQAALMSSEEMTQDEFLRFFETLDSEHYFPSLMAMSYSDAIHEPGKQVGLVTTRVAPLRPNAALVGRDVAAQPANFEVAILSRDSGQARMTAPFRLLQQAPGDVRRGVLIRLPVYDGGVTPGTLEARRRLFRGSVAVSFLIETLITDALEGSGADRLDVEVTDVTTPSAPMLLHRGRTTHGRADFEQALDFGGRRWQVRIFDLVEVKSGASRTFWQGLISSLLLAALVWSVLDTHARAISMGRAMGQRYRASEERFRRLNEMLPTLVLTADRSSGLVTHANLAARTRLGEVEGESLSTILATDDLAELASRLEQSEVDDLDLELPTAEGGRFWARVSLTPISLDGDDMWLLVASDVSEHRRLTERLMWQASHDALTRLYNRSEFEARVREAMAEDGGALHALLYIDLDQFKLINDTSGHVAGDELLVQLSRMMREQTGAHDVVARLGGDEFGILLRNIKDAAAAQDIAERIRRRLDGHAFSWESRHYLVSASIGGVMLSDAGGSVKELFALADTACYMAKEAGRNRVHFHLPGDDASALRLSEMEWVARLRAALAEGRMLLDYQEIRPVSGGPVPDGPCIELLLRKKGKDGRVLLPGAFMSAAERYGLMPVLDRWVIATALGNLDRLHPAGAGLGRCAINLSGATLEDQGLAGFILALVDHHAIDPRRLCFEITETVAVRNLSSMAAFTTRMRSAGCSVALDDFGSGMSSFAYLKDLDLDVVKIDGSFVRDLEADSISQSIVRAVTDIGHQRDLLVIAEWVSNESMLPRLSEIGVDLAQGYALHQPERVVFQR